VAAAVTVACALLLVPGVATADVFTVNTTVDANDNVCEQVAAGDCPLRAAVNDAADGDTINIPATKGRVSLEAAGGQRATFYVEDRCASTLTRVTRGRVSVRDFAKRKTVIVRAGKKYVARAKR
jgi:CSLREA domain-containing protein